jgi:polar amino acid transport system substrate-binding protein
MRSLATDYLARAPGAGAALALAFGVGLGLGLGATSASAQGRCDLDHVVQTGETYYSIANVYYGSRREWQLIFDANRTATGTPSLLPGRTLYIPCTEAQLRAVVGAAPTPALGAGPAATEARSTTTATTRLTPLPNQGLAAAPLTDVQPTVAAPAQPQPSPEAAPEVATRILRNYPENAELTLLTGGNYAPFTDQTLPEQGLITELVHAALDAAPSPLTYSVTWKDDWSAHLPALREKSFDAGFPWLRPDCDATPQNERCRDFHFSDPLMAMPVMLFVRADNQFPFAQDSDVHGRTLCRPEGYFTHDLDRADRRWISDRLITFVEGESPADCFYKVLVGEVDAATVNLFLGASVILEMGLRNQVVPLERPVSEEGLHVIISKHHWRATAHLYRINAGLKALKADGAYDEIVSRHLAAFQSRLQ